MADRLGKTVDVRLVLILVGLAVVAAAATVVEQWMIDRHARRR